MTAGYAVAAALCTISSAVIAEDGKPLAGVHVSLDAPGVHREAVTDASGSFTIAGVAAGHYSLTFTLAHYVPVTLRTIAVGGASFNLHTVVMHPSLTAIKVIGSVVSHDRLPFNTTPAALKVFPREAYRDQGQASVATVLDQTPGAIVARAPGGANAQPLAPYFGTMRGGLPWETATLIDGNPVSLPSTGTFNLAYVPSFVLQDVEIVKGYGAAETTIPGAEDGVLNFRTAEPGAAVKGLFEVEGDDRGGQFSDLAYGGSAKNGRFSFATMFSIDGNPGFPHVTGVDAAALRRAQLLKARYQVSSSTQVTATYLGSQGTLGVTAAQGFADGAGFASLANRLDARETHRLGLYSLELQSDLGSDHLTAKAYAFQLQRTDSYDPFAFPAVGSGLEAQDDVLGFSLQDDRQIGPSLYQLQLSHQTGSDYAAPLAPRRMRHEQTMLRAGAKVRAGRAADVQIAAALLHASASVRAFDIPVVHAGAAFHVLANLTVRGSIGSGALAPPDAMLNAQPAFALIQTPVGLPVRSVRQTSDRALTAETSFGYDAGAEYRFRGETTTLSADLYRTTVRGAFFDSTLATPQLQLYTWMNAPPMTHEGVEFALQQFKRVGLGFIAQASFVRSHAGDVAPLRVPYVQGYGEISYKWPRGSRASLGALYFGSNNAYARPAFVQFNANLELSLNDYSKLQFSVQNLGNVYPERLGVLVPATVPYVAGVVGPRTLRLMFRQSIGGSLFEH